MCVHMFTNQTRAATVFTCWPPVVQTMGTSPKPRPMTCGLVQGHEPGLVIRRSVIDIRKRNQNMKYSRTLSSIQTHKQLKRMLI